MQAKRIIVDKKGAPQLFREVPFSYLRQINLVETHSQKIHKADIYDFPNFSSISLRYSSFFFLNFSESGL